MCRPGTCAYQGSSRILSNCITVRLCGQLVGCGHSGRSAGGRAPHGMVTSSGTRFTRWQASNQERSVRPRASRVGRPASKPGRRVMFLLIWTAPPHNRRIQPCRRNHVEAAWSEQRHQRPRSIPAERHSDVGGSCHSELESQPARPCSNNRTSSLARLEHLYPSNFASERIYLRQRFPH